MDKLFVNGIIHSFDSGNRIYEAVGVTGEKIDGLGQEADLRKSAGHKTDLIDLKGSVMFPGLIDSHLWRSVNRTLFCSPKLTHH